MCFGRSPYARRASVKPEGATPRALAALGASVRNGGNFMQIYPNSYVQSTDNITISSFYFQDRVGNLNPLIILYKVTFSLNYSRK